MKRNKENHWTDKVIGSLVTDGVIDGAEAEAYRFGIEMLILKAVHVLSYILIALIMGKAPEFMVIFGVLCVFRRNTGGFHANTRLGCYCFSCAAIAVSLLLCDVSVAPWQTHFGALLLLLIMNSCPPVRNKNRRMDNEEAAYFKRRLKWESVIFSLVYVICMIFGAAYFAYILVVGIFTNTMLMALGKVQSAKAA